METIKKSYCQYLFVHFLVNNHHNPHPATLNRHHYLLRHLLKIFHDIFIPQHQHQCHSKQHTEARDWNDQNRWQKKMINDMSACKSKLVGSENKNASESIGKATICQLSINTYTHKISIYCTSPQLLLPCHLSTSSTTATVISLTLILSAIYQKRLLTRFQNIFTKSRRTERCFVAEYGWSCRCCRAIRVFGKENLSNTSGSEDNAHYWGSLGWVKSFICGKCEGANWISRCTYRKFERISGNPFQINFCIQFL